MAIFYCDSDKPTVQSGSEPDKTTSSVEGGPRRREGRRYKRPAPGQHMEPTHHICVVGVSEHEVEALRDASPSFGKVRSIERNAKVGLKGALFHRMLVVSTFVRLSGIVVLPLYKEL